MHDPFTNYDSWLQHDPAMDGPDDPEYIKCNHCGAFLKHMEDRVESGQKVFTYEDLDGSEYQEIHHWTNIIRVCSKCNQESVETEF